MASSTEDPADLGDFDFPQIDEGTPKSIVFGTVRVKSFFILWYGNYRYERLEA